MEPAERRHLGQSRFTEDIPLSYSKEIAKWFDCDLAVPNGPGLGNIVLYTRLVEDLGWHLRRPVRLLSLPMKIACRAPWDPSRHPLWENNPFVSEIVEPTDDANSIERNLVADKDDLSQFSHITENLSFAHGILHRANHGALYLAKEEMTWALSAVSQLQRPIVCVHPSGKSSSPPSSPWYSENWTNLLKRFYGQCSFLRVGVPEFDGKAEIKMLWPATSVRQMIALIWASDIFLGFDSGPGHVAAAFKKPAIILWDILQKRQIEASKEPGFESAMLVRWAYPQNQNIMIYGDRHNESFNVVTDRLRRQLELFHRKG